MDVATCMKIGATGIAGLFAGNAMYINLVEHPSRMQLDLPNNRLVWKGSFLRAGKIQGTMVILGAAAGGGAYYMDPDSPVRNLWLIGSGVFLSLWPFTLLFMIPDIKQNLEDGVMKTKGETWVKSHIIRWNKQHSVRTLVGLCAFGIFMYALSQK